MQREQEKKNHNAFRGVLSPTNLGEYDMHGRRASPTASVIDGRQYGMGMPPDVASLYSYNQPYGQPEPDYYRQQRLSIPVDGLPNVGYENDQMRYPSTGSYAPPSYGIPDDHMSTYKAPLETSPNDVQLGGTTEQSQNF